MKVHCRLLLTNKEGRRGEKKKDGKKNILQGPLRSGGPTGLCPVTGERKVVVLAGELPSRCCFLIGNSVSNKAFHLLLLVK